jgi:hypothetical protein
MNDSRRAVLAAGLLLSSWALAQERWDHRGAVGLLVSGHAGALSLGQVKNQIENSLVLGPELGLTVAVDEEGNELKGAVRATVGPARLDVEALLGRRGYFGEEQFKSFLDLDLVVQASPRWTVGPRVGFGLQYELSPVVGLYGGVGLQLGFGQEIRFLAGLNLGLQFRTYWLE